ncbi:MAG: family 1 encapsulin nanocompartment shell protein [Anaerolineae bacterium]
MADMLLREMAPFDASFWQMIDEEVQAVASQHLVGRRFLQLVGPFGAGALGIPVSHTAAEGAFRVVGRELVPFTTLSKEFVLAWEDFTTAERFGLPLELAPVALAIIQLAAEEDELIFAGLRQAKGTHHVSLEKWAESGGALATVTAALEKLMAAGIYGPYALVLSAPLYAQAQRIMAGTDELELEYIEDLVDKKVFFAPHLEAKEGFLIANAPYHLDLAVALDMSVAYLGNEGLDHHFRILERIALRIKNPQAICVLK